MSEESGDKESEDEDEERDPMPEVTEIRFIPDDANTCEFLYKACSLLFWLFETLIVKKSKN